MIDSRPSDSIQFRLSTIFVLTLVAAILAAFLSNRGNDLLLAGLVTTTTSMVFALLVGYRYGAMMDRVFWGIVAAAMMQAVCATAYLLDRSGIYAWPVAAGFVATMAAAPSGRYRRMAKGALMAILVIGLYTIAFNSTGAVLLGNLISAGCGGALIALLIEIVQEIERYRRVPLPFVGLILVLGAIAVSILAPRVIAGW